MKTLNAGRLLAVVGKGLTVPEGGWNAREFARNGAALMTTLHRVGVITQRKAIKTLAPVVQRIFKQQVERIITRVLGLTGGKAVGLSFGNLEALWAQAISEVLNEGRDAVAIEVVPTAQSVIASGYSRTNSLLGQPGNRGSEASVITASREIGRRITNLDETTRRKLSQVISDSIRAGDTTAATARAIQDRMTGITSARALTIARTEMNTAWTKGTVMSLKQNSAVTHVSVIGCEAREPHSPQWRGESTCNFEGIPMGELDAFLAVGFHPNHTGNIVPSGFA